jgi:hypothetical protein
MEQMVCYGCKKTIFQVSYTETAILDIEDGQVSNGSGTMNVMHSCGHQLSDDQLLMLGILE